MATCVVGGRDRRGPRAAPAVHLAMRATPDGSWIRWRYRRLRPPAQHRNDPGGRGHGRSAPHSRLRRSVPALPQSVCATALAGSRPAVVSPRVSDRHFSRQLLVGAWIDPSPKHRRVPAGHHAGAGLGDWSIRVWRSSKAGHASSPSWKIACSFFDSTEARRWAVSAERLVLAVQLPLKLLVPAPL